MTLFLGYAGHILLLVALYYTIEFIYQQKELDFVLFLILLFIVAHCLISALGSVRRYPRFISEPFHVKGPKIVNVVEESLVSLSTRFVKEYDGQYKQYKDYIFIFNVGPAYLVRFYLPDTHLTIEVLAPRFCLNDIDFHRIMIGKYHKKHFHFLDSLTNLIDERLLNSSK